MPSKCQQRAFPVQVNCLRARMAGGKAQAMTNASITFDTNVYRNFCGLVVPTGTWNVSTLIAAEQLRQISAYASPYVIMELASHLRDATDPHFEVCRTAIQALYEHCKERTGQLRMVADSESLIAHMLYGRFPASNAKTSETLAQLARAVALSPSGPLHQSVVKQCAEIGMCIDDGEKNFVADLAHAVQWLKPNCVGWEPFSKDKQKRKRALVIVRSDDMKTGIAATQVIKARRLLGEKEDGPDLEGMANAVLAHAPVAVALYRQIVELLISNGVDISKKEHANWIWDIQIVFGIGEELQCGLPKLTLITADKAIARAATEASVAGSILRLPEYLANLQ